MDMNDDKTGAEIVKDSSEALKNFQEIIGKFLEPRGIDAAVIEGHKKIIEDYVAREDIDEFTKMAFLSSYKKTMKEFKNCTEVVRKARQFVEEGAKPQEAEEDWFAFFFDKVRLVSDEGLQNIWGKILAGEVNSPGKFQRSLLHTLSIMSTSQAELFCSLAKFCMYEYKGKTDDIHPLIFMSTNEKLYADLKIHTHELLGLENLGLIQCDFKDEYVFHKKKYLRYGNHLLEIYGDPDNADKINAGNVRFTLDGRMLFDIVDDSCKRYHADILDFIISKFQRRNCKVILDGGLIA